MSEKKRKKIEIKSDERRKSTSPRVGCPFIGAGEEAEPRSWLSGLGQGGAAARPLDGGVLTRWGARAPARGPATASWIARSTAFESLSVALASLLCEERRERAKRKKGKNQMASRV